MIFFSWWYQPVNYDDEGNEIKASNIYNFQYNSEGGGSGVKFTKKKGNRVYFRRMLRPPLAE